jgi:hypothetical protein
LKSTKGFARLPDCRDFGMLCWIIGAGDTIRTARDNFSVFNNKSGKRPASP